MTVLFYIYPFYYVVCACVSFLPYGSPFFFYFVGNSESINHLCRVFLFCSLHISCGGHMESLRVKNGMDGQA